MKITNLNQSLIEEYNSFLHLDERNLIYLSWKYRQFLVDLLECDAEYRIVVKNNAIVGVLPMMFKDGALGMALNTLPFYGSHGGVVASDSKAQNVLIGEYNQTVSRENIAFANYVCQPFGQNDFDDILWDEIDSRIGQITQINLPGKIDDSLMLSYHSKTRNMVRKAIKEGVTVTVDNTALGFVQKVHQQNLTDIGGLAKGESFFELIPRHFNPESDFKIFTAQYKGVTIAALLLLYFNKTVEYFTPVILPEFRSLQPMSLLIYKAMIDASCQKFKYWNWGGTWKSQEGVYRFKKRWGAKDFEYRYYCKVNNEDVYSWSIESIQAEYSSFYIVPFCKISSKTI